ncbi:hypothetical protein WJX84_006622 [Apatococcus fuscideae]|uniref:Uncharacterized protein n=1 Tax=Apatococcus fuscideae TaxID=2026836 RepID=A0AAW1TK13_9CHLO
MRGTCRAMPCLNDQEKKQLIEAAVRCLVPAPQDLAAFPEHEDVSRALRAQKDLAAKVHRSTPVIMRNVCKTVNLESCNRPLWSRSYGPSPSSFDFVALRARTIHGYHEHQEIVYILSMHDGSHMSLSLKTDCVAMEWVGLDSRAQLVVMDLTSSTIHLMDPERGTSKAIPLGYCPYWVSMHARGACVLVVVDCARLERVCLTRGNVAQKLKTISWVGDMNVRHPSPSSQSISNPGSLPMPNFSADGALFALLISHGRKDGPWLQNGTTSRHHTEVHASDDLSVVGMYTSARVGRVSTAWCPTRNELIIAEWTPETPQVAGFRCLTTWTPETGPVVISCLRAPMQAPVAAQAGQCDVSWSKDGRLLLIARGYEYDYEYQVLETTAWRTLVASCEARRWS